MRTMPSMAAYERALCAVETTLAWVAGAVLVLMMALTTLDVVMRYAFNAPLSWVYDLLTNYLITASFFLAFSLALRFGDHVAVDFFAPRLAKSLRTGTLSLAWLVCSVLVGVIAASALHESYLAWAANEVVAGAIAWPVWPQKALVFLGLAPMALRMLGLALGRVSTVQADDAAQAASPPASGATT